MNCPFSDVGGKKINLNMVDAFSFTNVYRNMFI